MISRDSAAGLLTRLAKTTLDAFNEARALYSAQLEAQGDVQARFDPAVAAVRNGVDFWSLFVTCLRERYELLDGVERLPGTNPLVYMWQIDEQLLLQLKSDTGNLPVDQFEIPGVAETVGGAVEWIALTWDHDHIERFNPAFVQVDNGHEVWRIPVASILEPEVVQVTPEVPRSTVSSARPAADEAATEDRRS